MSERELDGRVAIITGGARNIGRAIALDLADGGAHVVVVARADMKSIRSTASDIEAKGRKALALQVDVTSEADVQRMVDETLEEIRAARHPRQQRRHPARSGGRRPHAAGMARCDGGLARRRVPLREGGAVRAREDQGHDRQYRRAYRLHGRRPPRACGRRESGPRRSRPRRSPSSWRRAASRSIWWRRA